MYVFTTLNNTSGRLTGNKEKGLAAASLVWSCSKKRKFSWNTNNMTRHLEAVLCEPLRSGDHVVAEVPVRRHAVHLFISQRNDSVLTCDVTSQRTWNTDSEADAQVRRESQVIVFTAAPSSSSYKENSLTHWFIRRIRREADECSVFSKHLTLGEKL